MLQSTWHAVISMTRRIVLYICLDHHKVRCQGVDLVSTVHTPWKVTRGAGGNICASRTLTASSCRSSLASSFAMSSKSSRAMMIRSMSAAAANALPPPRLRRRLCAASVLSPSSNSSSSAASVVSGCSGQLSRAANETRRAVAS